MTSRPHPLRYISSHPTSLKWNSSTSSPPTKQRQKNKFGEKTENKVKTLENDTTPTPGGDPKTNETNTENDTTIFETAVIRRSCVEEKHHNHTLPRDMRHQQGQDHVLRNYKNPKNYKNYCLLKNPITNNCWPQTGDHSSTSPKNSVSSSRMDCYTGSSSTRLGKLNIHKYSSRDT